MGTHGPLGKRSSEKMRPAHWKRNDGKADETPVITVDATPVIVPEPDEDWHPVARRMFDSLEASAHAVFYTQSDWGVIYLICENLSRDLKPKFVGVNEATGEVLTRSVPIAGSSLAAYTKMLGNVLATEADRRRLKIEVEMNVGDDDVPEAPLSLTERREKMLKEA